MIDRGQDPACQTIRQALLARLLDEWDPATIAQKMATKRADNRVLKAWAQQTNPPDQYRWALRPEMNYLDEG